MTSTCQLLLWSQLRWSLGSFGRYGRPGTYFFEDKSISVQNCIAKAVLAAKGWEEALQPVPNLASSPTPLIAGDNLRFPNCFVDGAWQESSLLAGMGWTLTCSATAPTIKDSSFRSKVGSALTAEALAFEKLFEAHWRRMCVTTLHIYSDSMVLVSTMCSGTVLNEIAGILSDIRSFMSFF